jgi:hypothetical protein
MEQGGGAIDASLELIDTALRGRFLDETSSYRGSVRWGTNLGGLRAVGMTRVGHAMAASFL